MSKRSVHLYVEDIKAAIQSIETYVGAMTFEDFSHDPKTRDAVVRNLEIVGEAVNNIPEKTKETYPSIPWVEITGMRNKIVHEYFGIDPKIIWETVKADIPALKKQIALLKT